MKHIIFIIFITYFVFPQSIIADGTAGENAKYETKFIVDMPTAGMLAKGTYSVTSEFIKNGTISIDFIACPYDFVELGIGYTFNKLIGVSNIEFQGIPGFDLKFRILNETKSIPAIAIGARTQGRGEHIESLKMFETFSPGVFFTASKNYRWYLGFFALHGGLNYSFEPNTNDQSLNFYVGFEQTLGKVLSINMEYNANLDVKNNKGLLNFSLRAGVSSGITIELQLRDLLMNQSKIGVNRVIGIDFINHF